MSRDAVCMALNQLYGYKPESWDGLTLAEMWQQLSLEQIGKICHRLGVTS